MIKKLCYGRRVIYEHRHVAFLKKWKGVEYKAVMYRMQNTTLGYLVK